MKHIHLINSLSLDETTKFTKKATDKYYIDPKVALLTIEKLLPLIDSCNKKGYNVADPFSGDGRLITLLIKQWMIDNFPDVEWDVYLFSMENTGLTYAKSALSELKLAGANINITIKNSGVFYEFKKYVSYFDCVMTNPPWENMEPDSRELDFFEPSVKSMYIDSLRELGDYLSRALPYSQPKHKFAGWGTNLSRVDTKLSLEVCNENGLVAIVMPASFFADEQSYILREKFLDSGGIDCTNYYPAEAKLFSGADISSCSFIFNKGESPNDNTQLSVYDKNLDIRSLGFFDLSSMDSQCLSIPVSRGVHAVHLLRKPQEGHPTWGSLEKNGKIWTGREIDETGNSDWTQKSGGGLSFIKGKMIGRHNFHNERSLGIAKKIDKVLSNSNFIRIA